MAEKRRLQQEVDRTLKRVDEGCDLFFDLHEKLRMQQSPKIENELKREIKKLQKLRDQIKSWQAHADIKEKGPLDEARRRIERGMEVFKQCERESKVKAFSREGLASRQRQAPEERHRERVVELLQQLQREAETAESEIEALACKKGRKDREREKKRLQVQLESHRWHVGKLELGLRLLDNESIDLRSTAAMCESVSEYLANCSNPDYVFDASIYDCLSPDSEGANTDLDLRDHASEATPPQTETPASASADSAGGSARGHSQRSSNSSKSEGDSSNSNSASSSSSNRRALSATQEPEGAAKVNSRRSSSPSNPTGSSSARQQQQQQQQEKGAAAGDGAAVSPPCWSAILQQQGPLQSSAAAVWGRKDQASASPAASSSRTSSNTGSKAAEGTAVGSVWKTGRLHVAADQQQQQQQGAVSPRSGDRQQHQQQHGGTSTANLTPWKSKVAATVAASSPAAASPPVAAGAASAAAAGGSPAGKAQAKQQQQRPAADSSSSSSSKRASAGGGTPQGSPTAAGGAAAAARGPADLSLVASMVAASCQDRPLPLDADFASAASPSSPFFWPPWIPRGDTGSSPFLHVRASWGAFRVPGNTNEQQQPTRAPGAPDCFPKGRLAAAEERQFFKRLDIDALFFAFYFQRGTLKQVYSAQELKAHAWRFHKKYLTWFQRHEEPRVSTDKFEEGTYVYFDYDNGWCSRIKHDFTFEYVFLEDEVQDSP